MAKETVQAVRNAELKAAQIEKDAVQKKEEILSKAQQEARGLIASTTKDAQAKADKALAEAEKSGAGLIEAAKLNAEKEILLLKEMVKNKEQAAIDLVLSNVI